MKIRWAPRRFEQDLREELRNRREIVIQAWARRIAGMELKKERGEEKGGALKIS